MFAQFASPKHQDAIENYRIYEGAIKQIGFTFMLAKPANVIKLTLAQELFLYVLHIVQKNPNPDPQQHFFQE